MEAMTVASLATALTALVNGAAGEAGKASWSALVGLIKGRLGHDSKPAIEAAELAEAPADEQVALRLAATLHEAVLTDRATAEWLVPWYVQTVTNQSNVNSIHGQAQVTNAFQAHTNNGGVQFGN